MSSALRRKGTDGSMRKRRARSLAGDDAFTKAESAPDCRCGPAIPTQTCAPARHAGSSTNDCRDHQPPILAAWRTRSHSLAGSDRSSIRRKSWPGRGLRDARLRRQDKSNASLRSFCWSVSGLRGCCQKSRGAAFGKFPNYCSAPSDVGYAGRRLEPYLALVGVTQSRDLTLDVLIDLDGQVLVVDQEGGHWVRFVVTHVPFRRRSRTGWITR